MERGMNLPAGQKRFFGTVTNVVGSTLTVQMQMIRRPSGSPSPATSPGAEQTVTVNLDSSTTYTGGSQADITTNTRVAGVGTSNNDGSLTAINIQINPTMPSGSPGQRESGAIRKTRQQDQLLFLDK